MRRFLAIDTSTEACSVALIDGDVVSGRFELAGNRHSALVLTMVEQVLAEAQLRLTDVDALGFSRGPGSFTGVRIGTAVIQGLACAADRPVIPVSTLALVAQGALAGEPPTGPVLACIDARMGEVYWACYEAGDDGAPRLLGQEQLGAAAAIRLPVAAVQVAAGTGAAAWPGDISRLLSTGGRLAPDLYPDARLMGPLLRAGDAMPAEQVAPVYLRNKVADKPTR